MEYTVLKSVQAARDIEEAFVYIAENDLDKAVFFGSGVRVYRNDYQKSVYRKSSTNSKTENWKILECGA